jgi:alpha-glucosidase (family GH31 glycosyl hydrolase)/AraC-like DNA-binding protein
MSRQANGFLIELDRGGWMSISPVAPHTYRIRLNDTGLFPEPALVRYGVVSQPSDRVSYSTNRDEDTIVIRTEAAKLCVDFSDGQFRWNDSGGNVRVCTAEAPWSSDSGGFGIRLAILDEEAIYGLGDVAPDRIDRRGLRADMWVAGTNFHSPVPFLMSSRGWAILMNTSWKHSIDIGKACKNHILIEGPEGELDFFLICGNGYDQLLNRYTDLAGKPRLLPMWAYGLHYFCSVESGGRQIVEDALKFRQEGIPCDLIGLSDGWTAADPDGSDRGPGDTRRLVISSNPGSESSAFIDTLHRHGFKLSLSLSCNHDVTALEGPLAELSTSTSDGKTERVWFDQLLAFIDDGVDAFKVPSQNQTIPHPDRHYANGMSDNELHNLYPVLLGKQMYEGYRTKTGKRPMIHAVVGYTGMQQFTATECGKYGLRSTAVISALNSGLSGHAHTAIHMHVDEPEGIHAGFLLPWAQNNSGRHFRHPCFLEEKQRGLFRLYARLRYRLLPYLYSTAHTAALTGMPIARAMPLSYPNDPNCRGLSSQYMLGADLLVAVFTKSVYLPEGGWIDYWTGDRYEGPAAIEYNVPEHAGGPLFVRAGAIIPMRPDMDFIGQTSADRIVLHVYPHGFNETVLREDDGVSFGYMDGHVSTTRIQCEAIGDRIEIRIWRRGGEYAGMPEHRSYEVIVHADEKPAAVHLGGERRLEQTPSSVRRNPLAGWKYDRTAGTLRLFAEEAPNGEEPIRIDIGYRSSEPEQPDARKNGGAESLPPAGSGMDETRDDSAQWLHIALDTFDRTEVEAALTAWWKGKMNAPDSPSDHWRTHLLDGCLLLFRHAERRGWSFDDGFGSDIANPLSRADIRAPEQGFSLLLRLAGEVIDAAKKTVESVRHPIIRETVALVQRELHKKLSLQEAAARAGIHPVYLSRLFKKEIGLPFSDYVLQQRMQRAKALLESGMKVYEAAAASGFQDASHFSRVYSQFWGQAPIHFRNKKE